MADEREREVGKCGREMEAVDVRRKERCMKWPWGGCHRGGVVIFVVGIACAT